jgi:hypothetical protein
MNETNFIYPASNPVFLIFDMGQRSQEDNYFQQISEAYEENNSVNFILERVKEINLIYCNLGYNNDAILSIGIDIIKECANQRKFDIIISKTGESELLIFRESNGTFNNIIIDEDGDIEFLHIPIDRKDTYNEHFPFIYDTDFEELISKL